MAETIGAYLIRRLREEGVGHVFGVPGDYCLTFFSLLEKSDIQIVNTCDEQGAGFAADAYARVKGLACCAITYCVGGLKVANPIAQAYAESSPVIVVSGAPGVGEQKRNPLLHHKVRDYDTQFRVFSELTVGAVVLDDPVTAADDIERMFALAKRESRPVYIELPRDMTLVEIGPARERPPEEPAKDPEALAAAVAEAIERIENAKRPVILAGAELHRFRLQGPLMTLVEKSGVPVAATIMSKSVFPESHPAYVGVYEGAAGLEEVRDYFESSDCQILLGAMMNDINLGIYTANISRRDAIYAAKDRVAVGLHAYDGVDMEDFLAALVAHRWTKREYPGYRHPRHPEPFVAGDAGMTVAALFRQIDAFLENDMVVIADPGDSSFGAVDLFIAEGVHFISPSYYCSLGFAVPAAVGVKAAAPHLRPLVLVGDGAFQMTGMEIATAARFGMNPIVIVLDNDGYGTERPMLDGVFNNVLRWNYAELPKLLGGGLGLKVTIEREMAEALARARANTESWSLIQVVLDRHDSSPGLKRLTAALAQRVRAKA